MRNWIPAILVISVIRDAIIDSFIDHNNTTAYHTCIFLWARDVKTAGAPGTIRPPAPSFECALAARVAEGGGAVLPDLSMSWVVK